ncbi:MAG: serine protease [Pseudomonadota bacterium]
MARFVSILVFALWIVAAPAASQSQVFIQIEAHPSLTQAQDSLRGYAQRFRDINGFTLGGGWYGIALGPYAETEAAGILRNLRAERLIPRDSYIARSSDYRAQFWPVGVNLVPRAALPETPLAEPDPATPPEETLREARANEARLTREDRTLLQEALEWAGFYKGRIDAAFGRGTRTAMARWQEANFYPGTGVLTTRQRAELLRQFNGVLEGLDIALVDDTDAGISLQLPTSKVAFSRYEAPFAHYDAKDDLEARVLLISQEGTPATLAGLYDIMQTLEIVPGRGARELKGNAFTLEGRNAQFVSYTEARLQNGHIKGFTLVWPTGDEERRTRVLEIMQKSFARADGVLPASAGSGATQDIDLVSGLRIAKPLRTRSGFFVDARGTAVTSSDLITGGGCGRITLDGTTEAEATVIDETAGIAVLRPKRALAPLRIAAFLDSEPRLKSDIAVAGYSYGGALGAPSVTFGTLAETQGLAGEPDVARLALSALDGDVGGPVVASDGAVLGMLLPAPSGNRTLPDGVSFAANAQTIRAVLDAAGIRTTADDDPETDMPAETLSRQAAGMTVLVSCWD